MEVADRFHAARQDPTLAVLEGFHALKHALRFGAEIITAAGCDPEQVERLATELAPDVAEAALSSVEWVDRERFDHLAPEPPATGVVAIARRPATDAAALLTGPTDAPLVLLERPNHLGNIGAVIRVAAAAGAAAVITTGDRDPWHPTAIRGSAGLHFALPVERINSVDPGDRPLVALDPEGDPITEVTIPDRPVLAFGSERSGLSEELRSRSHLRLSIPMEPGVSSLNLATSAAVVLFEWRRQRASLTPRQPGSGGSAGRSPNRELPRDAATP